MALTVESARVEYASLRCEILRVMDKWTHGVQISQGKLANVETLRTRHQLVEAYLAEHDPRFLSAQIPMYPPTFPTHVHSGFTVKKRLLRKLLMRKNLGVE